MNRIERFAFLMLVVCCEGMAASVAWSQEAPVMPKAGAEVKAIAPIFGTSVVWQGKIEAGAMGPDSKPTASHGKATGRSILGGMWYACDFEDTWGTGKGAITWKGQMTVGYDLAARSYKSSFVDNLGTFAMFEGTLNGTTLVLETPTEVMIMGTSMKDRLSWDFSDPKAIKFSEEHKAINSDWVLVESATLVPAAKPAAKPMTTTKE